MLFWKQGFWSILSPEQWLKLQEPKQTGTGLAPQPALQEWSSATPLSQNWNGLQLSLTTLGLDKDDISIFKEMTSVSSPREGKSKIPPQQGLFIAETSNTQRKQEAACVSAALSGCSNWNDKVTVCTCKYFRAMRQRPMPLTVWLKEHINSLTDQ